MSNEGVILSKLDTLNDNVKRIRDDIKTIQSDINSISNDTARQDERINTISKEFEKNGRIGKLEDECSDISSSLTNFKLQIFGIGAGASGIIIATVKIIEYYMGGFR